MRSATAASAASGAVWGDASIGAPRVRARFLRLARITTKRINKWLRIASVVVARSMNCNSCRPPRGKRFVQDLARPSNEHLTNTLPSFSRV
jgi:hypothetical protein